MKQKQIAGTAEATLPLGGVAGWLLGRLKTGRHSQPRLELIERIALAPRQTLSLVTAEGRRFLVATSPEGAPAFYALDEEGTSQPKPSSKSSSGMAPLGRRTKTDGERTKVARAS